MNPVYTAGNGSDGKFFVSGPGEGLGYYSGLMAPHMRLSNKADCDAAALVANEAYRQGWIAAQASIRKALGL